MRFSRPDDGAEGPADHPPGTAAVTGVPYGSRLAQLGRDRADEVALWLVGTDGKTERLTWAELDRRATQVGRWLAGRGATVGSRVALALHNSVELVLAVMGSYKVGAVPVPVRWDLPDWEHRRLLACMDPTVVLTEDDRTAVRASGTLADDPLPEVVSPEAWGICSSGSTGTPKVIVRAVPGLYDPAVPVAAMVDSYRPLARPQRIGVPAPMYHTNGFTVTTNLLGGEQVVLMERFDAGRFLGAVDDLGVTGFIAATPMLLRMARVGDFDDRPLRTVGWVQQGASDIPRWLARRWIDKVGPEQVFFSYGSTEGLGIVACRGDEWLAHPGTVGRPTAGAEVRILDEHDRPVPAGTVGTIFLRSATGTVHRYLGDAPPVHRTADGFGTVGDMGWLDEGGYLYVADRRTDLIVTGGANVYPAEVEAALSEHPDVADAVVIGLDDPEWGKRVHAVVQPAPGAGLSPDGVTAFVRERLAPYKVPKSVELVDRIPRTEAGKVNRSAMVAARQGSPVGAPSEP